LSVAGLVGTLRETMIFSRRARVLAEHLTILISLGSHILDVGCGDGTIDRLITQQRPDISIEGIDVLIRPNTQISVRPFDGVTIPYPDASFDFVMFVDVLHHTIDPRVLLREAIRVGKQILIKDHFREGFLADTTLRFMDWVGNAQYGVALPYNYWSRAQWFEAFRKLGLTARAMNASLELYPTPACWLFDRGLHFVARLEHVDDVSLNPVHPGHVENRLRC
jgi:SAM-dependent methyltransferase